MTYSSIESYIERFGERETIQLTNRDDTTATTVNIDLLQRVLSDASAEFDNLFKPFYQKQDPDSIFLFSDPIPSTLKKWVQDRTRNILWVHPDGKELVIAEDERNWREASKIRQGVDVLGLNTVGDPVAPKNRVRSRPGPTLFSRLNEGF